MATLINQSYSCSRYSIDHDRGSSQASLQESDMLEKPLGKFKRALNIFGSGFGGIV